MTDRNTEGRAIDSEHAHSANRLQELVGDLEGRSGAYALMREHLEAARICLVGAMPREYNFSLKLAAELVPDIDDKAISARIAAFLQSQNIC